jgi:hypothetical protein
MFQLEVNQVTILDDCWNFPDGKSTPGQGFLEQIQKIVVNPDMGEDEMSGGENCYNSSRSWGLKQIWLVVWNMNFMTPYIGKKNPN